MSVRVVTKESRVDIGAVLVGAAVVVDLVLPLVGFEQVQLRRVQLELEPALTKGLGLKPAVILGTTSRGASRNGGGSGSRCGRGSAGAAGEQEGRWGRVHEIEVGASAGGGDGEGVGEGESASGTAHGGEGAARFDIEKCFQLLVTGMTSGAVAADLITTLEKTLLVVEQGLGHGA